MTCTLVKESKQTKQTNRNRTLMETQLFKDRSILHYQLVWFHNLNLGIGGLEVDWLAQEQTWDLGPWPPNSFGPWHLACRPQQTAALTYNSLGGNAGTISLSEHRIFHLDYFTTSLHLIKLLSQSWESSLDFQRLNSKCICATLDWSDYVR